jgi:hypothetical protein
MTQIYLVIEGEVTTDLSNDCINYNNRGDWILVKTSSPEKALAFAKYADAEGNKYGGKKTSHPVGRKVWEDNPKKVRKIMDRLGIERITPEELIRNNPSIVCTPMQKKYK